MQLSDGQYDYANNTESNLNRLPPFPVSADHEPRSHNRTQCSTNGLATLGYEFDDNLVDGSTRPRLVGCTTSNSDSHSQGTC